MTDSAQRESKHRRRQHPSLERDPTVPTPGRQTLVGPSGQGHAPSAARPAAGDMWQQGVAQADEMRLAIEAQSSGEESLASDQATPHDLLDVVTQSFHWFNEAAQQRIEQLRRDLKKEDEPSWIEQLAVGALELAIGAGAAAAGKFLAEKLTGAAEVPHVAGHAASMSSEAHAGNHVGRAFVEHMFSEGSADGVKEGLAKLNEGKNEHVIDPFIDSQKDGVWGAAMANQTKWILHGRKQVHSFEDAARLKEACSRANVIAAAEKQYEASRDAWLSYLAQARFGAVGKGGPVTKDSVNVGRIRTDMSTQEQRDRDAKVAPGFRDATEAPDFRHAVHGDAPGVLEVVAQLPSISTAVPGADVTNSMNGTPHVTVAFLNGVNNEIREQYADVPLGQMHIPRQVHAKVDGAPDFTLNIDEQGNANLLHRQQSMWLRQRATVGHPNNTTLSDFEKQEKGRELLLNELVPGSISKERI